MPYAEVNGERLYYEISGNENAPKLVCIRGLSRSLRFWGNMREELEKNFHVLVYDHRGIGRSEIHQRNFRIKDMANDLAALMLDVGFAHANVFGISLGGMIAQELALDHADNVDKLILGCTWFGGRKAKFPSLSSLALLAFGARLPPERGIRLQASRLVSKDFVKRNPEAIAKWVEFLQLEPLDKQVVFQQALSGALHNTAKRISGIKKETLVVTGDADRLINMKNSQLLAEKIPNARLVVLPGIGHELPSEAGLQLVKLLQDFCLA